MNVTEAGRRGGKKAMSRLNAAQRKALARQAGLASAKARKAKK
jgi:hypothetical protein